MKSANIFIAVCLSAATATLNASDNVGDAVRSAVHNVSPSVVRIQIIGIPDRSGAVASRTTTGVVVSEQGEVVSSSFGFGGQIAGVFVEDSQGERYAAELVAQDHLRKLVLLRCETDRLQVPSWSKKLPQVGAWSVAVGRFYPTQTPSASLGVVSALNRIHGMAIQTDAKVSPVNYGGPLIGLNGQLFGILVPLAPGNESIAVSAGVEWYDSGIGFAVPAAGVDESVAFLRTGKDRYQGLLGIQMDGANPLSETLTISEVVPKSPAALAGMKPGDIIVAVADIPATRVGILESLLKRSAAGDSVDFSIQRGTERIDVAATLTRTLPTPQSGWIGVVPISALVPAEESNGVDGVNDDSQPVGVRCRIVAGSAADEAGVPSDTVVMKVNDKDITSTAQLHSMLRQVEAGSNWTLECTTAASPADSQSFQLSAAAKPEDQNLNDLKDTVAMIRDSQPAASEITWEAKSSDLNDDTHLWMLAPADRQKGLELGVVILLQDDPPVTDSLKHSWQKFCVRDRLVLAVVSRDNGLPVNQPRVLARVVSEASKFGTLDQGRIVLVAGNSHSEFVGQSVASPRLRPLKLAVFLNCRPVIDSRSSVSIRQKRPSILFVTNQSNAETRALLSASVTSLRSDGANVMLAVQDSEQKEVPADVISNWLWTRKIH